METSSPAKIRFDKLRCPHCHASATDIGTCPYCHRELKRKHIKINPKKVYKIVKRKGFNKGEVTRVLKANKDIVFSFFNNYSKSYKINFDASVQVHLKSEINEEEVAVVGRGNKTLSLVKISNNQPCECGCHDIAVDHERGETFCPKCGLISENTIYI